MVQLSAQVSHGGLVFLLMWGVGALFMGSVLTSRKGSGWLRSTVAAGLEGRPTDQSRAKNFGSVRLIAAVIAETGLIGIGVAVVLLARG
ncbi:hypothetical protein [Streptomyces sp. NPDC001286]